MDAKRRNFLKQLGVATLGLGYNSQALSNTEMPDEIDTPSPLQAHLIDLSKEAYAQVLIIGSGYGSSVTALRLAEAGVSSVILEMGKLWVKKGKDGKIFSNSILPDERAMWLEDRISAPIKTLYGFPTETKVPRGTGIIDVKHFDGIDACMARGVGGGSLANMAILIRASRSNIQRILPTSELNRFFSHHYPMAERMLAVNVISTDFFNQSKYYQYSRIALRHFKQAGCSSLLFPSGYDFNYMEKEARNEVPKSALNNEVGFGNNYGKMSLDKTYLAKAFGTGRVRLAPLTEVKTISQLENQNYLIEYNQRDEVTGDITFSGTIECSYLFLGAGSLGTTEILLRSKQRGSLANIPDEIGSYWGNNSEVFVAQNNSPFEPSGIQQSTVPIGVSHSLDQDQEDIFVMHLPLPSPIPTWISWHAAMTTADVKTKITFDASTDSIALTWGEEQFLPIERKAQYLFDKINAKNLTKYNKNLFGNRKAFSTKSAYHLLGGCTLNKVTNDFGQLRNHKNIFITDGSLLPNFIGVNPALTITALAERNIEIIIDRLFNQ